MSYDSDTNNGLDSDCLALIPNPEASEDHLYIPGSTIMNGVTERANAFCHNSLIGIFVRSQTPGPFAIYFNSDRLYDPAKPETGFSLYYDIF